MSNTTLVSASNAPTVLNRTASLESTPQTAQSANMLRPMGGGCEIPLNNGYNCGVTTLGRCATCGRAFCLTHQAREEYSYGFVPLVDMCVHCYDKTPERVAEAEEDKSQAEVDDAEQYIKSGAAQTALLAAGVQPVKLYHVQRRGEWKRKGILRRYSEEQTEVVTPIGGWLLGMFKWQYPVRTSFGGWQGGDVKQVTEDWQTALLALDTLLGTAYASSWNQNDRKLIEWEYYKSPFVRVKPYSGGYEALDFGTGHGNHFRGDWIAAEQAVRRLIGPSS